MVSNSGKSNIDLTLTRGLKNIKFVTKYFTLKKQGTEPLKSQFSRNSHSSLIQSSKQKNADWEKWKQFLQAPQEDYSTNFPLEISEKDID